MTELVQLVYASRATFQPMQVRSGVDRGMARILMQSRRNNPKRELGGVLYYDEGYFFQCLEGESHTVEEVFSRIKVDPRHRDLKILVHRTIPQRTFASWLMKYVPTHEQVNQFLKEKGLTEFDPYHFDNAMIEQIIAILSKAEDPTGGAKHVPGGGLSHLQIAMLLAITVLIVAIAFILTMK